MELIASGRDGDIFALTPGTVLRRTRTGRSIAHEARVMQYAAAHGYPVPRVDDVRADGTEIVMERIDGPMMMDVMTKDPRQLLRQTGVLADLHDQLHEIPATDWLPKLDDGGDRLLHLDLHPMNVMLAAGKPFVIDWSNAAGGDALTDVALTYVMFTCPDMPSPWIVRSAMQPFRILLGRSFARRYGRPLLTHVAYAAQLKQLDANMSPRERSKIVKLEARCRKRCER
jgi:aminoglycoside phosphotransferase (APT) family kinase protein